MKCEFFACYNLPLLQLAPVTPMLFCYFSPITAVLIIRHMILSLIFNCSLLYKNNIKYTLKQIINIKNKLI